MPAPAVAGALVGRVKIFLESKGFKKAQKTFAQVQRRLGGLREGMFMLGVTVIYLDRLIQSFVRTWRLLNQVMGLSRVAKTAADIQRFSEFTGVGTTRLQAFTAAAKEVGAELNDVADLFSTVTERVDDLRSGQEKGIMEDFARFGLSARDFDGASDAYEKYLVIARRMHELNQQEAGRGMALGEKALGGDMSRRFGALLEGGIQGLEALQQEAMSTGEVLTEQELKVGRAFERSRLRIGRVFTAVSNQLAMTFMPQMGQVLDLISWAGFGLSSFLKNSQQIRSTFAAYFQPVFDRVKAALEWWDENVKKIGPTILRVGVAIAGLGAIIQSPKLAAAWGMFNSLGRAAVYLGLVIEDLIGYVSGLGGASAFGRLLKHSPILQAVWDQMQMTVAALSVAFASLRRSAKVFFTGPLGESTLRGLTTVALGLAAAFAGVALAIEGVVRYGSMLWEITRPFRLIATLLAGPLGWLVNPRALQELDMLGGRMLNDPTSFQQDVLGAGVPEAFGSPVPARITGHQVSQSVSSTVNIYGSNGAAVMPNATASALRLQMGALA